MSPCQCCRVKAVGDSTVQMINDNIMKKLVKQNKGKELDAKEKSIDHKITIADVKTPHFNACICKSSESCKFTSLRRK